MRMKTSVKAGAAMLASAVCLHAVAEQPETPQQTPEGQPAIRLESTITGDKEQPAVSYFIPWQGTKTPDKLQWNIENKHDGTVQPVDRDVMMRSINIYDEMNLENR